jgi:hypothetical protein
MAKPGSHSRPHTTIQGLVLNVLAWPFILTEAVQNSTAPSMPGYWTVETALLAICSSGELGPYRERRVVEWTALQQGGDTIYLILLFTNHRSF